MSAIDLVSQVGFPAATALLMAWYVKYTTDRNYEQINNITAKYDTALENVREALTNLTVAITALSEHILHDYHEHDTEQEN